MNLKKDLQDLKNTIDKLNNKLIAARAREDRPIIKQLELKIAKASKKVEAIKGQLGSELSGKGEAIKKLPFKRVLTKVEQADMGKLKKSVRGIVVVHPTTALGREMGVDKVTGFAPKEF